VNEPSLPYDDNRLGAWLQAEGPDADLAICTRVRLARNLASYPFSPKLTREESIELTDKVKDVLLRPGFVEPLQVLELSGMDELDRRVLIERHLISRELASGDRPRAVAINETESVSVMINEEDHIRAQAFHSGRTIGETFEQAQAIDEALMARLELAYSEEFGFLTACPTNTGTGLRVSVMLHLPGLVWSEEIEKATHAVQKIQLTVRGLYGEGSRALGDFYQVSNQVTLGRTEEQILADVSRAVEKLLAWERRVREALLDGKQRARTLDRVFRALGILERARILTSEEALTHLSAVRLGIHQGVIDGLTAKQVNRALLLSQPAHLQRMCQGPLAPAERDLRRAEIVRKLLGRA
jgi:protein arginine kinase